MSIDSSTPGAALPQPDDDEFSLAQLIDTVWDSRKTVALIALLSTVLGTAYTLIATPIYEANILVQVEDSPNSASSMLGQVSALFDTKTAASAEIEIIRSRMVLSRAAESLKLHTTARPKYVPVVGAWLARGSTTLSNPGLLGLEGYVHGREHIEVGHFSVPDALLGKDFTLIAGPSAGDFRLLGPDPVLSFEGTVGKPAQWTVPGGKIELLVQQLNGKPGAHFVLQRRSMLDLLQKLQEKLKIAEKGKQSGVIGVTLEGSSPAQIADLLNAIGREYVRQNVERKTEEAASSLRFLEEQLPQLKRSLEASEASFSEFRRKQGTVELTEESKTLLQQMVLARTRLIEAQQKREELMAKFTATHPLVVSLDAQIRQARDLIASLEKEIRRLPGIEQDTIRITRDVKVNNELYVALLNNVQQLRLIKAGKTGNVRMVDTAMVPEKSVRPLKALIVALSAVVGAVMGVGAAFVLKAMRGGLSSPNQVERESGLPVFATIPHSNSQDVLNRKIDGKQKGNFILAHTDSTDPSIESLRSLRTALQFATLDARNNVLLITGPTPGLGKSFVSVNLAAVLAAGGKRTLLIDADLRRGHLNQYLGQGRAMGFSELIAGHSQDECIRAGVLPNLDFLSTGTLPPNPSELLLTSRLPQLIQALSAQYDQIVIDSAPVLAVSDTGVLGREAGTTFMVVRESTSNLGELLEATKRLVQGGIAVKGILYNDIRPRPIGYGYGYGYGYRYRRYRYAHDRYVARAD